MKLNPKNELIAFATDDNAPSVANACATLHIKNLDVKLLLCYYINVK